MKTLLSAYFALIFVAGITGGPQAAIQTSFMGAMGVAPAIAVSNIK